MNFTRTPQPRQIYTIFFYQIRATSLKYYERLKLLSIQSLINRRKIQCLCLIFNIKNRIDLFEKLFFNYAKNIFNELPKNIKERKQF